MEGAVKPPKEVLFEKVLSHIFLFLLDIMKIIFFFFASASGVFLPFSLLPNRFLRDCHKKSSKPPQWNYLWTTSQIFSLVLN